MVLAEDFTRQGLLDAMRKRHTYAATSNIILDFRLRADGEEHIQGDDFSTSAIPTVRAVIRGTNGIKEVAVVRDNQYVHTRKGEGERMEFEFREQSLDPGGHYYYVRVEQEDGNVAWASPIWVTKRQIPFRGRLRLSWLSRRSRFPRSQGVIETKGGAGFMYKVSL